MNVEDLVVIRVADMQSAGTGVHDGTVLLVDSADLKSELSTADGLIVEFIHRGQCCQALQDDCNLPYPVGVIRPDRAFPPHIEQSIDNAVILLVLALGSICECRDRAVSASPAPDLQTTAGLCIIG